MTEKNNIKHDTTINQENINKTSPSQKSYKKLILVIFMTICLGGGGIIYGWWQEHSISTPGKNEQSLSFTEVADEDELRKLYQRLTAAEEKIKKLQETTASQTQSTPSEPSPQIIQEVSSALDRINQLEQRLKRFETHQQHVAQVFTVFEEIKIAVNEARPFIEPLNRLAEFVDNFSEFQQPITELTEYAAVGVPTYHQLQTECAALKASLPSEKWAHDNLSWLDKASIFIQSLIHIEPLKDKSQPASTLEEAIKLAHKALAERQPHSALTLLEPFSEDLSIGGQTFFHHLTAYCIAERNLNHLNHLLSSPRFIQLLITPQ